MSQKRDLKKLSGLKHRDPERWCRGEGARRTRAGSDGVPRGLSHILKAAWEENRDRSQGSTVKLSKCLQSNREVSPRWKKIFTRTVRPAYRSVVRTECRHWFRREGTCVWLWPMHVGVWQKPTQYCKATTYPPVKNKLIFKIYKHFHRKETTLGPYTQPQ